MSSDQVALEHATKEILLKWFLGEKISGRLMFRDVDFERYPDLLPLFMQRIPVRGEHLDRGTVNDVNDEPKAERETRNVFAGHTLIRPQIDSAELLKFVWESGANVVRPSDDLKFDPLPGKLYTPNDLNTGWDEGSVFDRAMEERHKKTFDNQIFEHYRESRTDVRAAERRQPYDSSLMQGLHDAEMSRELYRHIDEAKKNGRKVVGFMGGHAVRRDSEDFLKTALLARELTRNGDLVITGGGPGIMEAANLGAYFAKYSEDDLRAAVGMLTVSPEYKPVDGYISTAMSVRKEFPDSSENYSAPTWKYGHEPPNQFATGIAKFFSNAQRENLLLKVCDDLVIAPGAAGTFQEVFQRATRTYYGEEPNKAARFLFMGKEFWNKKENRQIVRGLRDLLSRKKEGDLSHNVIVVDQPEDAKAVLERPRDERPPQKWFSRGATRRFATRALTAFKAATRHDIHATSAPAPAGPLADTADLPPREECHVVTQQMIDRLVEEEQALLLTRATALAPVGQTPPSWKDGPRVSGRPRGQAPR